MSGDDWSRITRDATDPASHSLNHFGVLIVRRPLRVGSVTYLIVAAVERAVIPWHASIRNLDG